MFGFNRNMFSLRKLFSHSTPPQIEYKKYAGYKYPAKLTVTQPRPISCEIEPFFIDHDNSAHFFTTLRSSNKSTVGTHSYFIDSDIMYGLKMETDLAQRNRGFGEFMRLISLITMKENHLKEIKIESLLPAIPFHRKYFFEPDIERNPFPIKILLGNIKDDVTLPEQFRTSAKDLLQRPQENFTQKINQLIAKIIDKKLFSRQHLSTPSGYKYCTIPMRLTSGTLNRNRDFFNALFKKHGIDYEI